MNELEHMSIGELAAYICGHLDKYGVECTLSGGACVSIYSENKFQSYDLDFIESTSYSRKLIVELMAGIGFEEKNRYFINPGTKWYVEFPTGPLSVGSEPVRDIVYLEFPTGALRIISPTECVKDRLAAYYFWDDLQSLEQAIIVSKKNKINYDEVERWSKVEDCFNKFQIFMEKLEP